MLSAFHDWLNERGYKGPRNDEMARQCVYFYRRVPGSTHQWIVREWELKLPHTDPTKSYELEMCYEALDGTWVQSKFYSLNQTDLREKLGDLEKRIYSAVEPMGGDPKTYDPTETTPNVEKETE